MLYNEVKSKINNLLNEPNLSPRISCFNDIVISAATIHNGKTKPIKKCKPWMTPHVRTKIHNRNRLRRTIHQNRQEWIDACFEATEAINKTKTESCKDLLQDAMSNSGSPNMWKVIQVLNSTPDANSPNSPMSHNGQTITDIKSKVYIFTNHYASVSKLNMSRVLIETSTDNSRNVSRNSWVNICHKKWKVKEQLTLATSHLYFASYLAL